MKCLNQPDSRKCANWNVKLQQKPERGAKVVHCVNLMKFQEWKQDAITDMCGSHNWDALSGVCLHLFFYLWLWFCQISPTSEKTTWTAKAYNFHVYYMLILASGGSKGARGTRTSPGSKFFQFHAFFGKIWQKSYVGALSESWRPTWGKS